MSETELRTVFNVFIDNKIVTALELQKAGFNVQNIKKCSRKTWNSFHIEKNLL